MKSRKRYFEISLSLILGICMWSFTSCNKDFKNVLPEVGLNDTLKVGDGSRRVLYIIMDGVKGSVLKEVEAANLREIVNRSIYTYDGIADFQRNVLTQAAAWTTMMTGVDYTKSQVVSDDFFGFDNVATPSVFTRIKDELGNIRTTSFSSSSGFNGKLAVDASVKQTLADDMAVKGATLMELTKEDPYLLVAQFNGAEKVASGDYSINNTSYVQAINTIDSYIGEILEALRSRKTFSGENWLVIVSSSKGGGPSGGTPGYNIFEDGSRNTFVAYYNPKFKSVQYNKPDVNALPYAGVSPKYSAANNNATQTDPTVANFGSNKEVTIRFNMRWDYGGTNYPSFVTKRASFTGGVVGWTFFMEGNTIGLNFSQSGQGNTQRLHTRTVADSKWHNIAARFWNNGSTRYVTLYVDGVPAPAGDLNITGLGNLDTSSPLRLGSIGDGNVNCIINDLAIYNVAIPHNEIVAKSRVTPLTKDIDPYFDKLQGYWMAVEGVGSQLFDITGKSAPFELKGAINWTTFSDISPNISPSISPAAFKSVPNGVDIPVMIYNWMNISVPKKWELMGRFYNPTITLPNQ